MTMMLDRCACECGCSNGVGSASRRCTICGPGPCRRSSAAAAPVTDAGLREAAKPDGWHTYHVCGGLLRELTWGDGQALCVVCGEWFNARLALSRQAEKETA